ncbi:MAG: hypothetical protein LBD93_06905 [Treponema sp.]|jgi:hypothetical protein|nr:hypothetical protein [Treponema sp.]
MGLAQFFTIRKAGHIPEALKQINENVGHVSQLAGNIKSGHTAITRIVDSFEV